ncbi:hypothetical protein A7982_13339 [Minicystis rosea]|nr:hypothetical protein A7982_13339 [Minicystis rosea]
MMKTCFDGYCAGQGAGSQFCGCWATGQDIDIGSCTCIPYDASAVCNGLNWIRSTPTC